MNPVAIELDFVHPALAARHLINRRRQRRFDEAGICGLDATGWGHWPGVRHRSNQPQGQLPGRTGVAGNEVMNMLGDGNALDIAAGLDFGCDIFRDVLRPMLKRIEGYNADRVVELPRGQQPLIASSLVLVEQIATNLRLNGGAQWLELGAPWANPEAGIEGKKEHTCIMVGGHVPQCCCQSPSRFIPWRSHPHVAVPPRSAMDLGAPSFHSSVGRPRSASLSLFGGTSNPQIGKSAISFSDSRNIS